MVNQFFNIIGSDGGIVSIQHPDDAYQMNWVEGNVPWGTVITPEGLSYTIHRELAGDRFLECYTFTNTSPFDFFTSDGEVGIYATFNDDYLGGEYLTKRCHTHIWCGGGVSYVCALRMGGAAPHLGLYLTKGSLSSYSVNRDPQHRSNDRGDFILHPTPFQLAPGKSTVIEWELFWHNGIDDFYRILQQYPEYIHIESSRYVLFVGEQAQIHLSGKSIAKINGQTIRVPLTVTPDCPGILRYDISAGSTHTSLELLALPEPGSLAAARCRFIAEKQQYHLPGSYLNGAYLAYDNETGKLIYSHSDHDRNGGRERVGMGVLMAKYLQQQADPQLCESLNQYVNYVLRELFDSESGTVYNDAGRNNDWDRLYNSPWMATFFLELYHLHEDQSYLRYAYLALQNYYRKGGAQFYAIDIPMERIIQSLNDAGMTEEATLLMGYFRAHCDYILTTGTDYAASEVNYEQSIVAPCADCLFQMHHLTGEDHYLQNAIRQLNILELFNGRQPDYHLNEVAIRHWDGYWFGKRKLYGDTFPHYWSSLTGNVYFQMHRAVGDPKWLQKAEHSLRGSLSLFFPDGSASCASLYPQSVNGQAGKYLDPWANDQDWALYYIMQYHNRIKELTIHV